MINDKEFLKFEEGFFKPYFEKFIEFKRGKGEKVASSTLIRFRKLNNSLNQYQTNQISEKMIRELLAPRLAKLNVNTWHQTFGSFVPSWCFSE